MRFVFFVGAALGLSLAPPTRQQQRRSLSPQKATSEGTSQVAEGATERGPSRLKEQRRLFVFNLAYHTTEEELGQAFASQEGVSDVSVALDRDTQRSRGFGFVSFGTAQEAEIAREKMDGRELGGRVVSVQLDAKKSKKRQQKPSLKKTERALSIALNQRLSSATNTAGEILAIIASQNDTIFDEVNVATALHRLGQRTAGLREQNYRPQLKSFLNLATQRVESNASSWKPRELSNAVWGAAKLVESGSVQFDAEVKCLFAAIGRCALSQIENDFETQALNNLAWAFAKVGYRQDDLLQAVALKAASTTRQLNSQAVANIAWAFASLNFADETTELFFAALAREPSSRFEQEFSPQELSMLTWACAKTQSSDLLELVAPVARRRVAEFNAQGMANVAWAFASVGAARRKLRLKSLVGDSALLESVALEAAQRTREFKPQELANLAWALAKHHEEELVYCAARDSYFEAMTPAAVEKINGFKPQELAVTAWAFSKSKNQLHENRRLFDAVARASQGKLRDFTGKELAMLARAFVVNVSAKTSEEYYPTALLLGIAREAGPRIAEFDAQAMANTAWAFATAEVLGQRHPLFRAIGREAAERIEECTLQALANLAWAFAKAEVDEPQILFAAIAKEAKLRLLEDDATPQCLSNLAWAWATSGAQRDPELETAILRASRRRLALFPPQSIANLLWALSSSSPVLSAEEEDLFNAVADRFLASLPLFAESTPRALSNVAWAFARKKKRSRSNLLAESAPFAAALARECASRLKEFSPQSIANLAWSYATVADSTELFAAIAKEAPARAPHFAPQALANLAWAFSTSGNGSQPELYEALAEAAVPRLSEFSSQALANTAWAYTKHQPLLLSRYRRLGQELARNAGERILDFNSQELANLAFAFSKLQGDEDRDVVRALFGRIAEASLLKIEKFQPVDVAQVAQAFAGARLDDPRLFDALAQRAIEANVEDFQPNLVAQTLAAFASTGNTKHVELFIEMRNYANSRRSAFSPKHIKAADDALAILLPHEQEKVEKEDLPVLNQ